MKTKIWTLAEWNDRVIEGIAKESDITNGIKGHIAIECPDCKSKLWQGKITNQGFVSGEPGDIACRNCHFCGTREVASE